MIVAALAPPIATTLVKPTSAAPVTTDSIEKLLTIVFPVVLGVIVLVLVALVVYLICTRQCCQTSGTEETVNYESGADNGKCLPDSISIFVSQSQSVSLNTRGLRVSSEMIRFRS